ncbi:MAG: hypothetical protein ACK5RA_08025 [Cyanobacteriota bacterium]
MLSSLLNSLQVRELLAWVSTIPLLGRLINRIVTNTIASATKPRPRPYSLWWPANSLDARSAPDQTNGPITDYASWPSLTDRSFSARHLAPAPEAFISQLPPDAPYDRKTGSAGAITSLVRTPSRLIWTVADDARQVVCTIYVLCTVVYRQHFTH